MDVVAESISEASVSCSCELVRIVWAGSCRLGSCSASVCDCGEPVCVPGADSECLGTAGFWDYDSG